MPRTSGWPARCILRATLLGAILCGAGTPARASADDALRHALPPTPPRFKLPEKGVLFADDFSADTLSGWTTDRPEVWTIRRGMLRGDLPDRRQERSVIRTGSAVWTDYAVDLDVCLMRGVDKGVIVRVDGDDGMAVDMRGPGYHDVLLQHGFRVLGRVSVVNGNASWHHLRVEARGHRYRVFINGALVIDKLDSRETSPAGGIALPAYTGGVAECTVYYDNVIVTALGRAPARKGRNR
jgi:hypothetical protein